MNDTWDKHYMKRHRRKYREAPVYISMSAAFMATKDEAVKPGAQYHHLVTTMESFYCEAYDIPKEDQRKFKGRGEEYKFLEKEI
eukprot:2528440-Pyramimonas_sp.AAC.1